MHLGIKAYIRDMRRLNLIIKTEDGKGGYMKKNCLCNFELMERGAPEECVSNVCGWKKMEGKETRCEMKVCEIHVYHVYMEKI